MFSKKKKGDGKADGAAPAPADAAAAGASAAAPAEANPAPAPTAEDGAAPEEKPSGGLLSSGLGAKKAAGGSPSIAASRLGGRPPARQSAPEPAPAPPPPPTPEPAPAAPPKGGMGSITGGHAPFTSSGQTVPSIPNEAEMSKSQKMAVMAGMPQEVAVEGEGETKGKGKNPYKPNLAFDVLLPVCMSVVLCGGFAMTSKVVKDKHEIYPKTAEERETEIRDKYLASAALLEDVKKAQCLVKLEAGDTAAAVAMAKDIGQKANAFADQSGMVQSQEQTGEVKKPSREELDAEEKTVKELLSSGMVLSRAGSKADKELGLSYMNKAVEICTYSKYARILTARELVRNHKDEEGIAEYEKINKLFPEPWPALHKELAQIYMKANRGTDAVTELTALMKSDPGDPSYQRQLGLAMAQNGDQQTGFEEFQKGFTHEQDVYSYPAAVKSLVDAHGGLVEATLADVKKQADKNPGDIKLQLDLARLMIATQKYKEARDLMETARKTHETNPEVHEVMAEIMCRQNQQTSGYDEFRAAAQNLHLAQ